MGPGFSRRPRWRRSRAAILVLGLILAATPLVIGAQPAGAATPLLVTYVARVCPTYADVMANKVRNNLQESLRDLGPNTNYAPNERVSVAKETAGAPLCTPLTGWGFATGTGITKPSPATQALSTVTTQLREGIVTQASTPELDAAGNPTGASLAGAVTVELSGTENAAAARNVLIAQGGTKAAPLNGLQEQYGFGALRCSADAVNGDNVEYVTFPTGYRHVYCFYYAVSPPPTAGTITVRKEIAPGSSGPGQFRFDGSLSYADTNRDGTNDFTLTANAGAPAAQSFVRGAGGAPWTFEEAPLAGWAATGPPQCTATNPNGPPSSTIDIAGQSVSVELGALDNVVCTFVNQRAVQGAVLSKQTLGGTGEFAFELVGEFPPVPPVLALAQTTEEGAPVTFVNFANLPPATYSATENLPAPTARGSWELQEASCNGEPVAVEVTGALRRSAEVVVDSGASLDCLVTNVFTPAGAISIQKTSLDGVGTFRYDVVPDDGAFIAYSATATTTEPGTPVDAISDDTAAAPVATGLIVDPSLTYTVTEALPAPTDAGSWAVDSADCGPNTVSALDPATASIRIALTDDSPQAQCSFVNRFIAAAEPTPSETPSTNPAPSPSLSPASPTGAPTDPATAADTALAATGLSTHPLIAAALLLITGGVLALFISRRSRSGGRSR